MAFWEKAMKTMNVPPEHEEWYRRQMAKLNSNPMVALHGHYPGHECKECSHLRPVRMARTYWKCDLRPLTHGPATDHRVHWPACAKFEERRK
jgi:ribosomal protein L37AE/L43A